MADKNVEQVIDRANRFGDELPTVDNTPQDAQRTEELARQAFANAGLDYDELKNGDNN